MNIVKVWVGEKEFAEYPDCTVWIDTNSPFVYVLPEGIDPTEYRKEKFVFVFPKVCTNISAAVIRQEDQP